MLIWNVRYDKMSVGDVRYEHDDVSIEGYIKSKMLVGVCDVFIV